MFPGSYFSKVMFTGFYYAPNGDVEPVADSTIVFSPMFLVNVGRMMNR